MTATHCEVLVIAGYHFKATCDIDMLEALASQGASMQVAQAKADADGKELAIGLAALVISWYFWSALGSSGQLWVVRGSFFTSFGQFCVALGNSG